MLSRTVARASSAANAVGYRGLGMAQQAKVLSSSMGVRSVSTAASKIVPEPNDEPHDVVFESRFGLRTILLNRPKKLNSLDSSMIRKIVPRMIEWEKSDMANVVVLKGAGEKALCAGGDVTALAKYNQSGPDGWQKSIEYFGREYQLDHYISTYKKPYIAFMDGITMGGGVGLSIHAPLRIATEKTVFAMPETTIGFFPDVGASFFLPRMNGAIGTYLALTSDRLTGPNVFYSGIATHYLHSTTLPDLENRLAELKFRDHDSYQERLRLINLTLTEYSTGLPYDQPMHLAGELRKGIDRCFNRNNIQDIIEALGQERGETEEWAQKTLATLQKRSPTAVHVALRQMRVAGEWDIAQTFKKEYQIASKFMQHHDFTEGVTALLVRKEKAKWQPETLEAIPASENVARPFFEADPNVKELDLFTAETYNDYPHNWLGVPSEKEVQKLISEKPLTPQELEQKLVASRDGRHGIAMVVKEIIGRKTKLSQEGKLQWLEDEDATSSKL